jgi:hypothetical protein
MTIRMYANRKKWPLEDIDSQLEHSWEHASDCADCDESTVQIDVVSRSIRLVGDLDETQRARLMEIADRCPPTERLRGHYALIQFNGDNQAIHEAFADGVYQLLSPHLHSGCGPCQWLSDTFLCLQWGALSGPVEEAVTFSFASAFSSLKYVPMRLIR